MSDTSEVRCWPHHFDIGSLAVVGHWHTEGYVSAVLTGSDLVAGAPDSQNDRLHAFLDAAVDASQTILADRTH